MYESVGVKHPQHQLRSRRREMGQAIVATLLSALATLIGLILLAWAVLFITKGRFLKPYFEDIASEELRRDVRVAGDFNLYLNPINIKFRAEGLTITNPPWARQKYFFNSKLIDTTIASVPLVFGNERVNWLSLLQGDVNLEWDAKGQRNTWTFGDPSQPARAFDLPDIRRAIVEGTHITYRAPQLRLVAEANVETVRASDTQFATDIRFSGGGTIRERPFRMSGSLLTPNETAAGGRNKVVLHATGAGNVVDVSGTLPGATIIEGADLRMQARGSNLATLLDFLGVAIPETRTYRFTSNLTKEDDWWRFTGLRGRFGDSDLAGRMAIGMPETRVKIDADLRSEVLDILDVGPWVGYDPQRLERMGSRGAITRVNGRPKVLPDGRLRVEALRTFDAHVDYAVRRVRMENFPLSNIAMVVDLDDNLLKLSPVTFDIAEGHIAADIIINARVPAVVTDYDIRLSPTSMGVLLARFGVQESGTNGTIKARVHLRGIGDSIRKSLGTSNGRVAFIIPSGYMWARNIQGVELDFGTFVQKMWQDRLKEPVAINCGLLAFTVRNGIAHADPILIDTRKNVIGGKGALSLRDETVNLQVEADAKTFSLLSAQSPIGVNGYWVDPKIDVVSGELIARGAAGLGLGILVNPFAAILAFVDPGNAEDTACGPVLAGARAWQQRERDGGYVKHIGVGDAQRAGQVVKKKKKKKFLGLFRL